MSEHDYKSIYLFEKRFCSWKCCTYGLLMCSLTTVEKKIARRPVFFGSMSKKHWKLRFSFWKKMFFFKPSSGKAECSLDNPSKTFLTERPKDFCFLSEDDRSFMKLSKKRLSSNGSYAHIKWTFDDPTVIFLTNSRNVFRSLSKNDETIVSRLEKVLFLKMFLRTLWTLSALLKTRTKFFDEKL